MWYPATVKTPASSEPVGVAAARRQCGIADSDTSQDAQLQLLIAAARASVEKYCGIRLPLQIVTVPCDDFDDLARLSEAPVKSVVSVAYVDVAGESQTVSSSVYEERLDGLRPSLVLAFGQTWPSRRPRSRIVAELQVGFEALPKDLESALLLMVAAQFSFARNDLLKRREDVEGVGSTQWGGVVEVNAAVMATVNGILENYRCWPLT